MFAGLSDLFNKPPEQIAIRQAGALAASGYIWSRYSLIITPKNLSLFAVNLFLGLTQTIQIYRAYEYQVFIRKSSV